MSGANRTGDADHVDEILAEYMRRVDRGEPVERERFIAEHPECRLEIRRFFNDMDVIKSLVESVHPDGGEGHKESDSAGVIRHIGDYELLGELGRGGMGVVYKARQQSLNRIVAVKLILPAWLDQPDSVTRFRREAQEAARLRHPNIVSIHEIGEQDGRQFFSMDYIDGLSLARLLDDGALPPRRAAEYVQKAARAIAYAHREGSLHRDLKPSNILIDAAGEPHVVDFGLAKDCRQQSDLTSPRDIIGSPGYMSPEQAEGRHKDIGPGTDIYGLGATLYTLLTGRSPSVGYVDRPEILPSNFDSRDSEGNMDSSMEPSLQVICRKCLERDPMARYHSADDLADDLQRYLASERRFGRAEVQAAKRWRWGTRTNLAAVTVLLAGCTFGVWGILKEARTIPRSFPSPRADSGNGITQSPPAIHWAEEKWESFPTSQTDSGNAVTQTPPADRPGASAFTLPTGDAVVSDVTDEDRTAQQSRTILLDELAPFGKIPHGWTQVGELREDRQCLERSVLIEGDYLLQLTLTVGRDWGSEVSLVLPGIEGAGDVCIGIQKLNSWSGVDNWEFQLPAKTVRKSLLPGTRVVSLRREGQLLTLSVDAVYTTPRSRPTLEVASWAADPHAKYGAIQLVTTVPGIRLERLRLDAVIDAGHAGGDHDDSAH